MTGHGLLYGTKSRGNKSKTQNARVVFFVHALFFVLNVMHAPLKFHDYFPYGLGVMAWTWFTIWN